jgi:hypothetical protein
MCNFRTTAWVELLGREVLKYKILQTVSFLVTCYAPPATSHSGGARRIVTTSRGLNDAPSSLQDVGTYCRWTILYGVESTTLF